MAVTVAGFELTLPVLVLGLMTGMTYGILAVGLVLVYRSNRVINFAHGEIGAFAGAMLSLAVIEWGFPYWVAFPLALGVGAAVGALTEVTVVRRLRAAPPLMTVIATLGVAQFLVLFSLAVYSSGTQGSLFPIPPWLPEFHVGALRVTRTYSAMLILSPLLVWGLATFLRRSRYGLAIRAAADDADNARLSAIFAGRMSTLSWALAGGVSAFTAVLVLPTLPFASAEFLGPALLLRALAAAVVGRMTNLPIAFGAGIAVGLVEQTLLWNYPRGGLVEVALFVVLLLVMLLQRRRIGRAEVRGSWLKVQAWPPLPDHLRSHALVRHAGIVLGAAALVVAVALGLLVTNATAIVLLTILAFALVGLSVGVVTGLAGELSLGQFALAGVGLVGSYVVTQQTGNFLLGFLAAGLLAAAVSLVIGLPAIRIRGLMLVVTTLGFAMAAQRWAFQQDWMLGEGVAPGRPIIGGQAFVTGRSYYFFVLGVFVLGAWFTRNVWRSGLGRRFRAIRDNEDAARAFAVPATAVKLQAFLIAGFLAGLGGAAFGHHLASASQVHFAIGASIDVVAMAALGGLGLLMGPLIGALYIIGVPNFVPLDNAGLAATSLGWLLLILYAPGGIGQLLRPLRDRWTERFATATAAGPEHEPSGSPLPEATTVGPLARLQRPRPADGTPRGEGVVLQTHGLRKHFGGITAVDGVDLAVDDGEILGLIGPNGAGKTTLFELIAGFTPTDGGEVEYLGDRVTGLTAEARARRGLVRSFQDAALFPTMTVLEVVQLAQERHEPTRFLTSALGVRRTDLRKERHARELIAAMGLDGFRDKQVAELSTGTRRIAELACLVATEPRVLLMDEPSSGIAQRETEALGELIARLRDELRLTMVVIEHDIPLISRISDRLVAMNAGRVIASGTPATVRRHPEVVESYLGGDPRAIERSHVPSGVGR